MVYTNCQFPVFFYIIYMYVKSFLDQLFISTSTLIHACLYRYRDKNTCTHIESWFLNCQFPWFFVHVNSYFNHHFVTQFKRVNLQKICMRKASSSGYVFYKMKKSIITTYPVQKCFKKHQAYMIVLSLDMALCISLICIEKKMHPNASRTLYYTHPLQNNTLQHHTTLHCTVTQHYLHTVMVTHGTHEVAQLHRHI